jgi:CO/xanthine dehydrogenase FAD-binding subunit
MLRVEFFQPAELREALEVKAAHPEAVAIAGGTDLLVDMNFDRRHPEVVLDLGRVPELRGLGSGGWGPAGRDSAGRDPEGRGPPDGGWIRLTAGTTFHELTAGLGTALPALAIASRTVGSPQIRHRATIGGNLATASPAGDAHPPLLATGAEVEVCSVTGTRRIPIDDFFIGPKRSALAAEELIVAVHVPAATGPQQFAKVGTRNAMVIAVCSFALALHPADRRVGTGIGSAGPVPLRAGDAEAFAAGALDWESRGPLADATVQRFGELVSRAARPIDDVRGTSAYRRHALGVLASRTLRWTWADYRQSGRQGELAG